MKENNLDIEAQRNLIREAFKELIRPDFEHEIDAMPLFEMGIDSLDFFEKIVYLEEDLGMNFSLKDITNDVSINDLVLMLEKSD